MNEGEVIDEQTPDMEVLNRKAERTGKNSGDGDVFSLVLEGVVGKIGENLS